VGWWIAAAGVALVAALLLASPAETESPQTAHQPDVAKDLATDRASYPATEAASSEDDQPPTAVAGSRPPLRRLHAGADNAIPASDVILGQPGETHLWDGPLVEPEPPTTTQNDPDWTLEEWHDPDFFAGRDPDAE
jgi:hypothetical protein